MSIPFRAKAVDLWNLSIGRAANFFVTAVIFALVGKKADAYQFAEFGLWWSIAIMIGGVALGGGASALVRVAVVHGTLPHLRNLSKPALAAGGAVSLLLFAGAAIAPQYARQVVTLACVGALGIVIQVQSSFFALLRAAEATRANFVGAVALVAVVPSVFYLTITVEQDLRALFIGLTVAFATSAFVTLLLARPALRSMLVGKESSRAQDTLFLTSLVAFTAVNFFSYASINFDFVLLKLMTPPDDFAAAAACKVFFERFALPALLLVAGAISLRVLRYRQTDEADGSDGVRLEIDASRKVAIAAALAVLAGWLGYVAFTQAMRTPNQGLPAGYVLPAIAGYLFYAVNAVLMDVLVIRRGLRGVVRLIAGCLVFLAIVQFIAIDLFGAAGWAMGWFGTNLFIMIVLARSGTLKIRS